jgi:hypothetical protein
MVTLLLLSTHHPWISWQTTSGHTSVTLHSSPMGQLAEHSWSFFCYPPLITRWSVGRVLMVTLRLLSTHHPWISWLTTAGHTYVTLRSSPMDQWQSTAGQTSVTLHSSYVGQLAEHRWSIFGNSSLIARDQLAEHSWVHFLLLSSLHPCVSWQSTLVTLRLLSTQYRVSAGTVQLVTLLLLSIHHPWINWQSTAGHISVTLQSSPVCQLAENTGHTAVTLHSTPVCQMADHSWSLFCYSPLITRGSAGKKHSWSHRLLSTHHPWISCQSTAGHTSVTLHLSTVDQLAEHSWSHCC